MTMMDFPQPVSRVTRVGNQLSLYVPKAVREHFELAFGDLIQWDGSGDTITLTIRRAHED